VTTAPTTSRQQASDAFTASINWGDGTTTTGNAVSGGHTYADEGMDTATVTVTRTADGTQIAPSGTVTVADAALSATGTTVSGTEGAAISDTTVATFTDANPNATASDFTATINWGDGTSTSGTVVAQNGGGFAVDGGHTYADEGQYTIGVSSKDVGGSTANVTGSASVADADVLTGQGTSLQANVNQALTNVTVASFSDTDAATPASDLTATIDWGDGMTTGGTVAGGNGAFTVSGTHSYPTAGQDTITVTLSDDTPGNASAIAVDTVTVSGTSVKLTIDPVDGNNVINNAEAHAVGGVSVTGMETGLTSGATFSVTVTDETFSRDYAATVGANGSWEAMIPSTDAVMLASATVTAQVDSAQASESVVVDTVTPSVSVSINNTDVNVANSTATVTFTFSEAPVSFSLTDTTATGRALSNLQQVNATDYTATFTAAVDTYIGDALVSVTAGSWSEHNGNPGSGGSTANFIVDTVTPSVSVSINNTDVNVANNTATVTFTFSEAPVSFSLTDTTASGGALSNLQQVNATAYTATFTAAVDTYIGNAEVGVTAGSWSERNGNPGSGGSTPNSSSTQ
jgi:ribosomal protein L6P/L9E